VRPAELTGRDWVEDVWVPCGDAALTGRAPAGSGAVDVTVYTYGGSTVAAAYSVVRNRYRYHPAVRR